MSRTKLYFNASRHKPIQAIWDSLALTHVDKVDVGVKLTMMHMLLSLLAAGHQCIQLVTTVYIL